LNLVEVHLRVAAFQNVANPLARFNRAEAGFLHGRGFGGHDLDMSVDLHYDVFVAHFHRPSFDVISIHAGRAGWLHSVQFLQGKSHLSCRFRYGRLHCHWFPE
jgi:hypothetical protein